MWKTMTTTSLRRKKARRGGSEKGKTVTTRTPIPRASPLRPSVGAVVFGSEPPLPVSSKYTVHRACNVPLSVDPTGPRIALTRTHRIHTRTRTQINTGATNTRTHVCQTRARPRVGVCPMICSTAIMPLADTLRLTLSLAVSPSLVLGRERDI